MKRKSQFAYLGTDLDSWKQLVKSGFKEGTTFYSDFFTALMAASSKTYPVIGLIEIKSEDGLSVSFSNDSWGRNSQYSVQNTIIFQPISLRVLTYEEMNTQLTAVKEKGHDFSWILTKVKFE